MHKKRFSTPETVGDCHEYGITGTSDTEYDKQYYTQMKKTPDSMHVKIVRDIWR